jgi:hypothetical protein
MNTATYRKQGMLSHIKENLYNRIGKKDAKLVHAHIALMMNIVAIRRDALLFDSRSEHLTTVQLPRC